MFGIKSPGNVNAFNEFFVDFATFNAIDFDSLSTEFFYFPEVKPYSLNFMMSGYETIFIVPALGLSFYAILTLTGVSLLYMLMNPVAMRLSRV